MEHQKKKCPWLIELQVESFKIKLNLTELSRLITQMGVKLEI